MFLKWKGGFENMGLIVNLGKTTVMLSGGITKDDLSKSKVDPCWVCRLRVKANSVLCGKWTRDRCAGVKMVTQSFLEILHAKNVK